MGTPFDLPDLPDDEAEAKKMLRPKKIWEQEVRLLLLCVCVCVFHA